VNPRFEQAAGNFTVCLGGNCKADRIDTPDQLAPIGGPLNLSFCGDVTRSSLIEIADPATFCKAFCRQRSVNASVLSSQMAHAYNSGAYCHSLLFSRFGLA
jgi:hypothetical protein